MQHNDPLLSSGGVCVGPGSRRVSGGLNSICGTALVVWSACKATATATRAHPLPYCCPPPLAGESARKATATATREAIDSRHQLDASG